MFKSYRKVNMDCFSPYGVNEPVYASDSNDASNINWSDIMTKLIQLAGRLCNNYASDIILDINTIQDKLENSKLKDGDYFMFGFREFGVDHNSYVECQTEGSLDTRYREIWKMDIHIGKLEGYSFDQMQFKLYRVSYNSYANKNEE